MDGEKIEVSMDGKKVIKVKDSEIEKGQIALITEQRLPLTVIDDFVVRPMQKKGFFSKITDRDEGTEAQRHKELQASSKKAASLRLQDSSYMPNSQRVKWQDSSQGTGPNPENDYETYNFELETLNHKLSNSSTPEPVLPVSPFSPDSPDPIYQTTSSLPPSELVYYYHHDHLGNIRAVTDQNGNVVERHDFYPFGEEITTQPQSTDQYLFTGKPRDSETGLDYFGKRYYSSSLCRWMSVDPAEAKKENLKKNAEDPQRWNLYLYCRNNPLIFIDPSGSVEVKFDFKLTPMSSSKIYEKYGSYGGALVPKLIVDVEPVPIGKGLWSPRVTIEMRFDIYYPESGDPVYDFKGTMNMPKTPEEAIAHELGHMLIYIMQASRIYQHGEQLEQLKLPYIFTKAIGELFELESTAIGTIEEIWLQKIIYETLSSFGYQLIPPDLISREELEKHVIK